MEAVGDARRRLSSLLGPPASGSLTPEGPGTREWQAGSIPWSYALTSSAAARASGHGMLRAF